MTERVAFEKEQQRANQRAPLWKSPPSARSALDRCHELILAPIWLTTGFPQPLQRCFRARSSNNGSGQRDGAARRGARSTMAHCWLVLVEDKRNFPIKAHLSPLSRFAFVSLSNWINAPFFRQLLVIIRLETRATAFTEYIFFAISL